MGFGFGLGCTWLWRVGRAVWLGEPIWVREIGLGRKRATPPPRGGRRAASRAASRVAPGVRRGRARAWLGVGVVRGRGRVIRRRVRVRVVGSLGSFGFGSG